MKQEVFDRIKKENFMINTRTKFDKDIKLLQLPDYQVLRYYLGMTESTYETVSSVYQKLGQFDYQNNSYEVPDSTDEFYQIIYVTDQGRIRYYMGQGSTDLSQKQGMGMLILDNGQIEEGYYLNGVQHGPGRCIFPLGGCYIGNFYRNEKHGYGTYVSYKGDKYYGYYKADDRHKEGIRIVKEDPD